MKKYISLIAVLFSFIVAFSQNVTWQQVLETYRNGEYAKAIDLANSFLVHNDDHPGALYVIALSDFHLAQKQDTAKQFQTVRHAINMLYNARRLDKDSSYYDIFKDDVWDFHKYLYELTLEKAGTNGVQARYLAQSLIFLFYDTTDVYKRYYPDNKGVSQIEHKVTIPEGKEINAYDSQGRRQGLWVKYYSNGNMKYAIYFKNGHPAGEFKRFYPNGQLWVDMKYTPDGRHASATFYDRDGHRIATGYYYGQQRDSLWRFYVNDTVVLREVMYKKGVKNGFDRVYSYYYYPNLLQEYYYKNGKQDSVAVDYYYDGTPKNIRFFKNGVLDGPYQVYYYTGQVQVKGQYKNGYMDGKWLYYNSDGSVDTIIYKNGRPLNDVFTETETKIMKAMEKVKGKYPEPADMFRKQYGLEDW